MATYPGSRGLSGYGKIVTFRERLKLVVNIDWLPACRRLNRRAERGHDPRAVDHRGQRFCLALNAVEEVGTLLGPMLDLARALHPWLRAKLFVKSGILFDERFLIVCLMFLNKKVLIVLHISLKTKAAIHLGQALNP
ncbi:MAG TPA: hypothetical protein P5121_35265, partial [Caldilineaceae bacterium]|nr:hypothetical protein [Caldilineaceae bacterium]